MPNHMCNVAVLLYSAATVVKVLYVKAKQQIQTINVRLQGNFYSL